MDVYVIALDSVKIKVNFTTNFTVGNDYSTLIMTVNIIFKYKTLKWTILKEKTHQKVGEQLFLTWIESIRLLLSRHHSSAPIGQQVLAPNSKEEEL